MTKVVSLNESIQKTSPNELTEEMGKLLDRSS